MGALQELRPGRGRDFDPSIQAQVCYSRCSVQQHRRHPHQVVSISLVHTLHHGLPADRSDIGFSSKIKEGFVGDRAKAFKETKKTSAPHVTNSARKLRIHNKGLTKSAAASWEGYAVEGGKGKGKGDDSKGKDAEEKPVKDVKDKEVKGVEQKDV